MALDILINSKTQRPSVCNAAETLLVHADIADDVPAARAGGAEGRRASPCTATSASRSLRRRRRGGDRGGLGTEYLSLDIAAAVVDSLDEAVAHIRRYGSGHTEAIVTTSQQAAEALRRAGRLRGRRW